MNVTLTEIHRSFGKNRAVDGVSIELGTGVFGLLGPNGAGKTSLLRMLATVLPPSSGEIRLLDRAFAGGLAAWTGLREGRRKTVDLVATTPRAAWARLSIALAGTLCWVLLAFLAGVAVLYIQTALQATWGGPPLWPVFTGAAGVTVVTVIGFTFGVLFPGRFTAPLVAIGVLVLDQTGLHQALSVTTLSGTYALLSPANVPPLVDTGVYYQVAPDLSIVQVMFMGGIAIALFGALGLVPELRQLASARGLAPARAALARGEGWLLRAVAVVLVACGVAASWTAFALAGTAKPDAVGGWQVPALH